MKKPSLSLIASITFRGMMLLAVLFSALGTIQPAEAATTLTVAPITWNVIGLDSNNVNVGPNHFPVGAHVCNTGGEDAQNVIASLVWDTTPVPNYIAERPGTTTVLPALPSLAAGDCTDFYFEIEVSRNSSAYGAKRRYHIAVSADGGATSGSTPTPRELYVERLVSQSRNAVNDMQLSKTGLDGSFTSIPAGGTLALTVGNTYWIRLVGATATNGYEQIESFINLPNTIFQVEEVESRFTAGNTPIASLYGDACGWINDPNSPNYMSCSGTGKQGGGVTVTYKVTVLSVPSSPLNNPASLETLIYDFSGSSFHYNGDFAVSSRVVAVVDPLKADLAMAFTPDTITVNGVTRLTVTISNTNATTVSGYNFSEALPATVLVSGTPNTLLTACGSGASLTISGGNSTLNFSGGTIAANSSCTIQVDVTASVIGTYTYTIDPLLVDSLVTGETASATLDVVAAGAAPARTCNVELATWNMGTGANANTTPDYTFRSSHVGSATTAYSSSGTPSIDSTAITGGTPNYWKILSGWAGDAAGYPNGGAAPYFQFSVDSSRFTDLSIEYDYYLGGNWANAADNEMFVYSSANGGTSFSNVYSTQTLGTSITRTQWYSSPIMKAPATGASTTIFRINFTGQQSTSGYVLLDNVKIYGCEVLDPPTVEKTFSPSPVAVGGTSALTFTVTNLNQSPSATLTGISLNDFLPLENLQGTVAVTSGSTAVTGTGTAFRSQLAANSIVVLPAGLTALAGTVSVTAGSATVTGTGTSFTSGLVGNTLVLAGEKYVVSDVLSTTSLRLSQNYAGATASGLSASSYQKYSVASISDDTHLTLSAAYSGSTASGLAMAAGLTLTGAPATTCRGAVTGAAGGDAISLSGSRLSGTIAVTSASANVTGTGTAFQSQLSVGSRIAINGVNYRVATITSNTALTLSTNYGGATTSGLVYTYGDPLSGTIAVTNASAAVTGTGTAFQSQLVTGDVIYINRVRYTVSTITSNTALTLTTPYADVTASGLNYFPNRPLRGTVALTNGSAAVVGTNTYFSIELAASGLVYINGTKYIVQSITDNTHMTLGTTSGSTTSGLVASREDKTGLAGGGSATCAITATVKANGGGVRANVSDMVNSTESGANTTSSGYARANLTAVLPPVISMLFSPNPIQTGSTSTLTFTVTNPNQGDTLNSVAFADTYPAGVTNTTPASTSGTTCSGTVTTSSGGNTITLAGATLAAGASCVVKTTVTATSPVTPTSYTDSLDTAVSHVIDGATVYGNSAADTLVVNPVHPAIAVRKQVGASSDGPWYDTLATTTGSDVFYRFTVENIGDVAFTSFTVTDPTLVPADLHTITCSWSTPNDPSTLPGLPVGTATIEPTASCVVGPVTAATGAVENTATAHGVYSGTTYNSSADSATYKTAALSLAASVTESYYAATGNTLHYRYAVTNSGFAALDGPFNVVDNTADATACPAPSTAGDGDDWLEPGETLTCTGIYAVQAGDTNPGDRVLNAATASGDGITTNEAGTETPLRVLNLSGSLTNDTGGNVANAGTPFTWTLTVNAAGEIAADFDQAGQVIARVTLPAGPTYGGVTEGNFTAVTNSGNISCAISGSTLTCETTGAVSIANGGSFTASFSVTPHDSSPLSASGSVDPDGVIVETNENNNGVSDSLTVIAIVAVDEAPAVIDRSAGGTAAANVLTNDTHDGAAATTANVSLAEVGTWPQRIDLNPATGAVTVSFGAPLGEYSLEYEICDLVYTTVCDQAVVPLTVMGPTALQIEYFRSRAVSGGVELVWKTGDESSTSGFNLYRREVGATTDTLVNAAIIPAVWGAEGGVYVILDPGATAGKVYEYRLEEYDSSFLLAGSPVRLTHWPYVLFLGLVR